jgi:DNA repair exonuclease SbcCD ATPase subunit
MMARIGRGGVIAAVVVAAAASLSGQTAPARQPDGEVLNALLVEVRGLRAAMEQMASAGPRVQLFASRLQLQEARINNMIRRLDTVRDRIAESQQALGRLQADEKQFQAALEEHRASSSPEAREEANQASFLLKDLKAKMALAQTTLNRQLAEESQLVGDLTTEQGRWNAINQQLDELERTLGRR